MSNEEIDSYRNYYREEIAGGAMPSLPNFWVVPKTAPDLEMQKVWREVKNERKRAEWLAKRLLRKMGVMK